nr:immunoglobulin light chain junction region [Macaca mulatta]MOX33375.1 immunoglobulin light chain junction region [Macaca mulatta]
DYYCQVWDITTDHPDEIF